MSFKILIAEDEDITLKHLVAVLKSEGYEYQDPERPDALRMIEGEYSTSLSQTSRCQV